MYGPDAPAVTTRDPAAEASATLLAQMEMERGTGKFSGVGRRIDMEREFRPQYAQLDLDSVRDQLFGTTAGTRTEEYYEQVPRQVLNEAGVQRPSGGGNIWRELSKATTRAELNNISKKYENEGKYSTVYDPVKKTRTISTPGGGEGMLSLMARAQPELSRIQRDALSTQRAGDIADVANLAGASRAAYEQLNPEGAALLRRINALRMEEMENPYAMSEGQRRGSEQNVRGAQSVRGMGMGPTDAFQEAMYLGDRQRGLYNERMQGAGQTIGLNQSFYGDPFQQILGRPGGSNPQGLYAQAKEGVQNVFDPYSSYFGNAYGFNANAQNASAIAEANNSAAITGAMFGAVGQLGGATIGAGLGKGGFMRCWVAREVFGQTNPEWMRFRTWLETRAPRWFFRLYNAHGERFAAWVADKPIIKSGIRRWMRARIAGLNSQNPVLL